MNKKGKLFIISAPSGSGKTTLCKRLLALKPGLKESISMTTRPRRPGEADGRDYHFVSTAVFKKLIARGRFLEWTRTYGWYYGTPKDFVSGILKNGGDILLSIDVKGAMNVRRMHPESVLIFVLPPSIKELKARLIKRNSDVKKEIKKRLKIVKRELSYAGKYDYRVVNDNIGKALGKLRAIVIAERCK